MWGQIQEFVQTQLASNEFLAGGAMLGALAAMLAYLRIVPMLLAKWSRWLIVTDIDIPDRSPTFNWVGKWLAEHPYTKRARRVSVETFNGNIKVDGASASYSTTPAPGWHFIWYRHRPMILRRVRNEGTDNNANRPFREAWQITFFGQKIEQFMQDCAAAYFEDSDKYIKVATADYDGFWRAPERQRKRNLDSVILPRNSLDELLEDVKDFLDSSDWYNGIGIPWRRGYLLYGPPGNGKSSLVSAIAGAIDYSVYTMNLKGLTDQDLTNLVLTLPSSKAILLMEDIDAAWDGRETEEKISFSNLLNLLDGLTATEGRIVVMTTNHIDKLDSALIRPGRIDYKLELKNANYSQIIKLYQRFFPAGKNAEDFAARVEPINPSMAALQGYLLRYRHSAKAARANIKELQSEVQNYQ